MILLLVIADLVSPYRRRASPLVLMCFLCFEFWWYFGRRWILVSSALLNPSDIEFNFLLPGSYSILLFYTSPSLVWHLVPMLFVLGLTRFYVLCWTIYKGITVVYVQRIRIHSIQLLMFKRVFMCRLQIMFVSFWTPIMKWKVWSYSCKLLHCTLSYMSWKPALNVDGIVPSPESGDFDFQVRPSLDWPYW